MHSLIKAAFALGALVAGGAVFAQPAPAPWTPDPSITASLDIGGSGNFTGVFDKGQLCYMINAAGVMNPTAAVIRSGRKADNGAVVLTLSPPAGGSSGGCVPVADDMRRHWRAWLLRGRA